MNSPLKRTAYAGTRRKLPQNYDVTLTCDLMEFPLRALAHKIYFYLKLGEVDGPPRARQINKIQNFYS